MRSIVISTAEIYKTHTAENIASALRHVFNEWQIESKIVTVITDNAASMKKAVNDFIFKRNHYCVAHTINLSVKDCIEIKERATEDDPNKALFDLLNKCRGIVSHFKHSTKSSYSLIDMQKQMNLEILKLKQDVRTRWNSTFYMLERLLKLKIPLSATLPLLDSPPNNLNSNEWLMLEDAILLLQPFEKITCILSGEAYPTLSSVIPLVLGLRTAISNKSVKTSSGNNYLKRNLMDVVEKRLGVYEHNRTAAKATLLDPRFKKKGFTTDTSATNAQMWAIEEVQEIISSSINDQTNQSVISTATSENTSILFFFFFKMHKRPK